MTDDPAKRLITSAQQLVNAVNGSDAADDATRGIAVAVQFDINTLRVACIPELLVPANQTGKPLPTSEPRHDQSPSR